MRITIVGCCKPVARGSCASPSRPAVAHDVTMRYCQPDGFEHLGEGDLPETRSHSRAGNRVWQSGRRSSAAILTPVGLLPRPLLEFCCNSGGGIRTRDLSVMSRVGTTRLPYSAMYIIRLSRIICNIIICNIEPQPLDPGLLCFADSATFGDDDLPRSRHARAVPMRAARIPVFCRDPPRLRVLGVRVRTGLADTTRRLRVDLLRARRVPAASAHYSLVTAR